MNQNFYEAVADNPIIAAVKNMEDVTECCKHDDIRVIFILFGDVCSIGSIVKTIRDAGKIAMVHMDLISGLSPKEIAVEFIKEQTEADGIISTKLSFIKRAKELGMATVFRFFVIDSMAFDNIQKQYEAACPDFVEILPGIMPKIIAKVAKMVSAPVIAGGLIAEKADIYAAIEAGAISISSTNQNTWFI